MGSPEIDNCEYNLDLGMRTYGRPTTFCRDVYVGGNLYVTGEIFQGAGEPTPLSAGGEVGPCFDEIKVANSFLVEGDACFKKSIQLSQDIKVGGILASTFVKVLKNAKVEGSLCVNQSVRINESLETSSNAKVGGRLVIGEGNIDCELEDLAEAKVVLDGTVLITDTTQCKTVAASENIHAEEVITNVVRTNKLVVRGRVYRERQVEVLQNGSPITVTVLVREEREDTPGRPDKLRSCPIGVPCIDVTTPAPPCPSIDC